MRQKSNKAAFHSLLATVLSGEVNVPCNITRNHTIEYKTQPGENQSI